MRERLDRAWPSLVALVGTVGIVLTLLVLFGDDTGGNDDGSGEEIVADSTDEPEDDGGTEGAQPDGNATDEPTGGSTDGADGDTDEDGSDETADPDEPTEAPEELRTPIGVANQTTQDGLELTAAGRFEAGGWEVAATSGFTGTVPETTVYYPPGLQESAEALAAQFPEIGRVKASFEGLNPDRIVVILVDDYLDEVEE